MTRDVTLYPNASADRLANNLMLDLLQFAWQQSGVPLSSESRNALQDLRDLINGNQERAVQQCAHDPHHRPHGAHHSGHPQHGGGTGREGPLQMLTLLLMLLQQLMQQQQGRDAGCHHGRPDDREALRNIGDFFTGLGEGLDAANRHVAQTLGIKIH
jgi:hypothetical protein